MLYAINIYMLIYAFMCMYIYLLNIYVPAYIYIHTYIDTYIFIDIHISSIYIFINAKHLTIALLPLQYSGKYEHAYM